MSKSFFAPSITLENGASILTGDDSIEILFPDGGELSYRAAGGEFDECDVEFLNYETLIRFLVNPNVTEDFITGLMDASREAALKSF